MSVAVASVVHEHPRDERPHALTNAQVGVLLFLASEALLFAGLVAAAIVLRAGDPKWSAAQRELLPALGWIGTALLLAGSLAVARALARARRGTASRTLLAVAAACGLAFLGVQASEYALLLDGGMRWTSGVLGSCFWVLTFVHGLHVLAGVAWIATVAARAGNAERIELASWYWHLVDGVWIVLFGFFYLL